MENQPPLDPRPNATEITELSNLDTYDLTIKIKKIRRADVDTMVVSSRIIEEIDYVIIEEIDYWNARMLDTFCVGDCILKVNDEPPQSAEHFKEILCDLSPCTVTIKRRSFVTAPGRARLRRSLDDMGLPFQYGYSYQVVNCKKQTWDRFLMTEFGFIAHDVNLPEFFVKTNKFVIGEIYANSAAEKYFSVGDALIDFRGTAIRSEDDKALDQFNTIFQKGKDMDVLIERPVSQDARNLTQQFIKKYLIKHRTPVMNEDAVEIGKNAAFYHNTLWSKIEAVGILKPPPPPSVEPEVPKKKKNWKIGKSRHVANRESSVEDVATAVERTNDADGDDGKRITLEEKKSYQEISTDVSADKKLEPVGYRYSSEGEDDEEEKEDDDKSRRRVQKAAAPRGGLFSLFTACSPFKK